MSIIRSLFHTSVAINWIQDFPYKWNSWPTLHYRWVTHALHTAPAVPPLVWQLRKTYSDLKNYKNVDYINVCFTATHNSRGLSNARVSVSVSVCVSVCQMCFEIQFVYNYCHYFNSENTKIFHWIVIIFQAENSQKRVFIRNQINAMQNEIRFYAKKYCQRSVFGQGLSGRSRAVRRQALGNSLCEHLIKGLINYLIQWKAISIYHRSHHKQR